MKFLDNNGKTHKTYVGAMLGAVSNKVNNIINNKFKGYKEAKDLSMDDDLYDEEITDNDQLKHSLHDINLSNVQHIPVKDRDEIFVPGKTPKVKFSSKDVIKIDYENSRLILEGENHKVLNITQIDPRLFDCPIKDIINMVYDINCNDAEYCHNIAGDISNNE